MKSLLSSVGFIVVFVLALWLVGELVGFEVALWSTLLISVALTVIANLAFAGWQRATA